MENDAECSLVSANSITFIGSWWILAKGSDLLFYSDNKFFSPPFCLFSQTWTHIYILSVGVQTVAPFCQINRCRQSKQNLARYHTHADMRVCRFP